MTPFTEFSCMVPAAKIGFEPTTLAFEADERALKALARRFDIMAVGALAGSATLHRESDGVTIAVSGRFCADVTQACVATLDPVPDHIEETFEGWFLDESQVASFIRAKKRRKAEDPDELPYEDDEEQVMDERDDPDPVVGGLIDVGELVAQYLSLALNPYPHSPEALAKGPFGDEAALKRPNPFEALKDLKSKG